MTTLRSFIAAAMLVLAPALASAQDSRETTFQAGAQHEDIPGGVLLLIGYGSVFVLLLGYVITLGQRQSRIASELDQLRRDIEKREPK